MENLSFENQVVLNLIQNSRYFRIVYPNLNSKIFEKPENQILFDIVKDYYNKYSNIPNFKQIGLILKDKNLSSNLKKEAINHLKEIVKEKNDLLDENFLIDKTKDFIIKRKLTDAILDSVDILKKDNSNFVEIYEKIKDSISVNFNREIGMEYNKADDRFEKYTKKDAFTPILGMKKFNKLLGGGIRPASLYMILGAAHSGKTAQMCFLTGSCLLQKENVLYITLEMPEDAIAKRIDASLLGFTIQELEDPSNTNNIKVKWNSIKDKLGNLVIKEYGAGSFSSLDLENLLDELRLEKNFIPDTIMIDHLILMYSPKVGKGANSYEMVGKVSEELHAISKKYNDSKGNKGIKMISGMQANRSAYNQTDMGLDNMSESIKVAMTADVVVGLISNEELRANNQQIWKLLKNRYTGLLESTLVQTDFSRMTYSEIETEDFDPNDKNNSLPDFKTDKFNLDTSKVYSTEEESPLNFDNLKF